MIGKDYYRSRGRRKKHSKAITVLIGLSITAGTVSHRKAREVVRVHLGMNIYISDIHYRLRNFGELMGRINDKIVEMNMGFLRRLV